MSRSAVWRRAATVVAATVLAAVAGIATLAGTASAASSSPFACDQPAWAGGVAMTISVPANSPADVPVPRPCLDETQLTVTASAGTVATGTQNTVPPSAQFVRYTPAPGQPQGAATLTFTTASGQVENVAVNVAGGGANPAPDVVAIGDSVTAAFGYCGSADNCDLDSKINAWWLTLDNCQQEAEYPNAPIDLRSNTRASGGLPWSTRQGSGGTVAYPFRFGSWLDSASAAAQQPQPGVRNWAVSGARPAHWDPVPIANDPTNQQSTPGAFSPQTEQIRDSLVVMTLGANRLLSDFLAFQFSISSMDKIGPYAT